MDRTLLDEGFATGSVLEHDPYQLPPERDDEDEAPGWLSDPMFAVDAFLLGLGAEPVLAPARR